MFDVFTLILRLGESNRASEGEGGGISSLLMCSLT